MPDGSVAPDFTLTDLNGTSHNLYNLLDDGYTVFIDFSAIWCGPCWGYHTSGALEDLYMNHGPAGYPNVNANTTDDVMVFFIKYTSCWVVMVFRICTKGFYVLSWTLLVFPHKWLSSYVFWRFQSCHAHYSRYQIIETN